MTQVFLNPHQVGDTNLLQSEDLYSCRDSQLTDINLYDILQNADVNTLSIEDSNAIEGPIKYDEASHVLKAMSNNRSPGSDGFSAEFFKMFWKK